MDLRNVKDYLKTRSGTVRWIGNTSTKSCLSFLKKPCLTVRTLLCIYFMSVKFPIIGAPSGQI